MTCATNVCGEGIDISALIDCGRSKNIPMAREAHGGQQKAAHAPERSSGHPPEFEVEM
jgi:hypothetical protein